MKLRIKGNSIRLRLTKTEVASIATKGHLEEHTNFGPNRFEYALIKVDDSNEMSASFINHGITVYVPDRMVRDWPDNDIISLEARIPTSENETLYILVEKDFVCLDHTTEDQSDNYPNPNKAC